MSGSHDSKSIQTHRLLSIRNITKFGALVLRTSSVHGLNHLAARNRHSIEKVFWTLIILLGMYGAYHLAQSTLHRYEQSPTVTSLERNYQDWNTTFPSVTLCPNKKINNNISDELLVEWFGPIDNRSEIIEWLDVLARATYDNFDELKINDSLLRPSRYLSVLSKASFQLEYSASDSNGRVGSLTTTITERGLCYSFNSFVALYNSPKYWEANNWTVETEVTLFKGSPLEGDIFAQIMELNTGYLVLVHSPFDVPDTSTRFQQSEENRYLSLDISVLPIVSSDDIKSLSIGRRNCRFIEESNLESSPVYSYNQCRSECRKKLAHKLCNCVPYFHRPMSEYPVCGIEGMKCLGNHKERLIKLIDGNIRESCHCLPSCNEIEYNVFSYSSAPWYLGTNFKYGLFKYPRTRLKRELFFTRSDLLVQLGGSASLCLGCSFLSFLEFVYLFTLRLFLFARRKTN